MSHQKSALRRALLIAPALALVALVVGRPAGADVEVGGNPRPTIVLVHGDWADASSWTSEIERLQRASTSRSAWIGHWTLRNGRPLRLASVPSIRSATP